MDKNINIESNNKIKIGIIILISFLLICIMIYIYNKHISLLVNPEYKTNNEYINKNKSEAVLYFFHATWCPHSKKALPIIQNFEMKVNKVNSADIKYRIIDGEKEEDLLNSFELKHKIKIDSFPTIYLEYNNDILEYNVNLNEDTLMQFLKTVIK